MIINKKFCYSAALLFTFWIGAPAAWSQATVGSTLLAENYAGKLDQLLTLEMAAQVSGFDASKAIKEHENKAGKAFGNEAKPPRECNYLWGNGRTRSVSMGASNVQAKIKDKVGINWVSNTTLERFKRNYPVLSAEQKVEAAKKLDEEHQKTNGSSSSAADKEISEVGNDMITSLETEEVRGTGEAAVWYPNSNELKVFYKGLTFAVIVDVSDNKETNKTKALELANKIIIEKLK
jgi:hypothetical protein